jgi:hypothetical protein
MIKMRWLLAYFSMTTNVPIYLKPSSEPYDQQKNGRLSNMTGNSFYKVYMTMWRLRYWKQNFDGKEKLGLRLIKWCISGALLDIKR